MLARSVTLNILGTGTSLFLGFFSSLLLARWLGPSGRGLLAIMVQISSLTFAIAAVGLPIAVMYFASRPHARTGAILVSNMVYGAVLAAVFIPAFWLLREPIADLFSHGRGGLAWVLAGALVPLTFLDWTTHNQLVGKLRFGLFNVLLVVAKIASVAAIVLLVGWAGIGVTGALIATAISSLVMIVGSLPPLLAEGGLVFDRSLLRSMIRYGSRVQIGTILQLLNYRLDVIILQFYRPLSAVGYYVVASILAELVITVANAFQSSVLPLVSHYEGDERQAATSTSSLRHHGILAVAATLGNAVFAPLVIIFLYGSRFHPALLPLFILLPGMWFLGTGTVVAGDLRGRGYPGLSSAVAGAAVVITVVLDVILIPFYGVPAAAIVSVIAYVVYGVTSLIVLSRVSKIPVRELVMPTREDLALYPAAARRLLHRRKTSSAEPA
ncbi:MAG: oligosaccharide flippase family protein [Gaiellaceae bacterium]